MVPERSRVEPYLENRSGFLAGADAYARSLQFRFLCVAEGLRLGKRAPAFYDAAARLFREAASDRTRNDVFFDALFRSGFLSDLIAPAAAADDSALLARGIVVARVRRVLGAAFASEREATLAALADRGLPAEASPTAPTAMGAHGRLLELYHDHLAALDGSASPRDGAALARWRTAVAKFARAADFRKSARPALARLAAFSFYAGVSAVDVSAPDPPVPEILRAYALVSTLVELCVRDGPRRALARLDADDSAVADLVTAVAGRNAGFAALKPVALED